MAVDSEIYIGWDDRESVCSDVAAHSIRRRSSIPVSIEYLKHRELRKIGLFKRLWLMDTDTGEYRDGIDGKNFTTQFSHTRFLVPAINQYKGWALFMDPDMVFISDIAKLFALADDRYAVMCVKHQHIPCQTEKMDGRAQVKYRRKNWSSFVLWNCGHPANTQMTPEKVNFMSGYDLHNFVWLTDQQIGELPFTYNFISGVSPKLPPERHGMPDVIHYTDGGPWFDGCKSVPYAGQWIAEYEEWQKHIGGFSTVPSIVYEPQDRVKL